MMFRSSTRACALLTPLAISFLAMGLVAALAGAAEGPTPEITLGSVALNVTDLERSRKYYKEVLGFERVGSYPPEGKPLEVFLARPGNPGGASLILAHLNDEALPEGKNAYGRIIVNTSDAEAVAKRAKAAGSKTRTIELPGPNPPVIIFFEDPDGYEIELYQAPTG